MLHIQRNIYHECGLTIYQNLPGPHLRSVGTSTMGKSSNKHRNICPQILVMEVTGLCMLPGLFLPLWYSHWIWCSWYSSLQRRKGPILSRCLGKLFSLSVKKNKCLMCSFQSIWLWVGTWGTERDGSPNSWGQALWDLQSIPGYDPELTTSSCEYQWHKCVQKISLAKL